MLIFFVWLGTVFPERYNEVIYKCQNQTRHHCVLLGEPHWNYYIKKYRHMLNVSDQRIKVMLPVERADLIRLLYIYENGGVYTDLDNAVDYNCLDEFLKDKNTSFFAAEQHNISVTTNAFIYAPSPHDPQIERVLLSLYQRKDQYGAGFVGPWFLRTIPLNFTDVKKCAVHLYHSVWIWWTHKANTNYTVKPQYGKTYSKCLDRIKKCKSNAQFSSNCSQQRTIDQKQLQNCQKTSKTSHQFFQICSKLSSRCSQQSANPHIFNQSKISSPKDEQSSNCQLFDNFSFQCFTQFQYILIAGVISINLVLGFLFCFQKPQNKSKTLKPLV